MRGGEWGKVLKSLERAMDERVVNTVFGRTPVMRETGPKGPTSRPVEGNEARDAAAEDRR